MIAQKSHAHGGGLQRPEPHPPRLRDPSGKLQPDAFDHDAADWARYLAETGFTLNQMRNFFHNMKEILAEAQANQEGDFSPQLLRIRMLKSQVAYAVGRGNAPPRFKKLIDHLVGQVKDLRSYELACCFMEAVVGYFTYEKKPKDARQQGRGR